MLLMSIYSYNILYVVFYLENSRFIVNPSCTGMTKSNLFFDIVSLMSNNYYGKQNISK